MRDNKSQESEVQKAERKNVEHLAQHYGNDAVTHELNRLRDHDSKQDLGRINEDLQRQMAAGYLPPVAIVKHRKDFEIRSQHNPSSPNAVGELPESRVAARDSGHPPSDQQLTGTTGPSSSLSPDRITAGGPSSHADPLKNGFADKLAQRLRFQLTPENGRFIHAWYLAENGSADNPLNTSYPEKGQDHVFNSDGVRRYASINVGVDATANTLLQPEYKDILNALKRGTSAHDAAEALEKTSWGTRGLVKQILDEQESG